MSMELELDELNEIVRDVFASLAGEDLSPSQVSDMHVFRSGRISVDGAQPATITLEGNREIVAAVTAVMFDGDPDEMDDLQMSDAWAELTNMVGGNIKCLLADEGHLGLPEVGDGPQVGDRPPAAEQAYRRGSERLRCRVYPR